MFDVELGSSKQKSVVNINKANALVRDETETQDLKPRALSLVDKLVK
jgi:hypothetical protein